MLYLNKKIKNKMSGACKSESFQFMFVSPEKKKKIYAIKLKEKFNALKKVTFIT